MARTSSSESSRASVTRLDAQALRPGATPSALVTLICVLPWIVSPGAISRASLRDAHILHDHGVRAGFGDGRQGARGLVQFVVEDQGIESDVAFHAAPVQSGHDFRQFRESRSPPWRAP